MTTVSVFTDIYTAIETRFNTLWANRTLVKWQNRSFQQPASADWVDFHILGPTGARKSLGNNLPLHRWAGVVNINVYVKETKGTAGGFGHADRIAEILHEQSFASGSGIVRFFETGIRGAELLNGWYVTNTQTTFTFDSRFSIS